MWGLKKRDMLNSTPTFFTLYPIPKGCSKYLDGCLIADEQLCPPTTPCVAGHASWWTPSASQIQQLPLSNNLNLRMATPNQRMGFQFHDQDTSSTQSAGQSYRDVASMGESNPYGQSIISTQSGCNGSHGKSDADQIKSAVLTGTQDCNQPHSQVNYRQSFACVPLSYADPCYGGLLAVSGPQALIHQAQIPGIAHVRGLLPLDLPQDEPIYVNPKQYHAIVRRRQYRAKLEAQNKLSKARKPYLHESRHLHAIKRARGSGGRFLNTKKLQESKPTFTLNGQNISGSTQLHLATNVSESVVHLPENYKEGASTTSSSDITSASNSDSFFQQECRFSLYPSGIGRAMQSGAAAVYGGNQQYLSVHR